MEKTGSKAKLLCYLVPKKTKIICIPFYRNKTSTCLLSTVMEIRNNYYSGTSGLLLPVPNKLFYPEEFREKSRLCYYASLMNTIEINSSFYKVPLASTVKKWASDVSSEFQFTFKLYKEITHKKNLDFDPEELSRFFQVIAEAENKKGCILVQFPPSIQISHFPQLQFLMARLRANDPAMEWKIALEFRHSTLYTAEVYELLEEYSLGMVVHDKLPVASPIHPIAKDFVYLRFHGPEGDYKGSYTDDVLYEYADYIEEWLSERKKVYVYFNNTMGEAIANLNKLGQMVQDRF